MGEEIPDGGGWDRKRWIFDRESHTRDRIIKGPGEDVVRRPGESVRARGLGSLN